MANNNMTESDLAQLSQKFNDQVIGTVKSTFVGKDEIVDLLCIGLVAQENLFILGPPGTAKSALVQTLAKQLDGRVFDYLLTRFTEPNEVFGPFDIRKLRDGELVTNTEGMLPEADFVFLDELLNANSAILNSLLMVLNERVFRRGRENKKLGTLMVVGASNRLPEDDALNALFDRFLLRVVCDNVATEQLQDVLVAGWDYQKKEQAESRMTVAEIHELQDWVNQVDFGESRKKYVELIQRLRHAGIDISDRRAVKLQRVLASSAILAGRLVVNPTDFWVLKYIWDSIQQREVLAEIVTRFMEEATEEEKQEAHKAAENPNIPNPEQINQSLDAIEIRIESSELNDLDVVFLKDQISLIKQRSQWVANDTQRDLLDEKATQLLARIS